MTPKQILIAAIRLTVVVWMVKTVSAVVPLVNAASVNGIGYSLTEIVAVFGFYGAMWLFLWFFPATIARFLLPKIHQEPKELPKHPAPWLTTGLILIGFYTLSLALPDLTYLYTFYQIVQTDTAGGTWSVMSNQDKAGLFAAIVQALSGIFLIFGAPFVSRQIRKCL